MKVVRDGGRTLKAALLAAAAWVSCWPLAAASGQQDEYQVKAAFLLNFVKYVEWPAGALAAGAPISVALLGERGVPQVEAFLAGKTAQGRAIVVRRLTRAGDAPSADVLFVAADAARHLDSAVRASAGKPVLTVSEVDDGPTTAAIVNLLVQDGRIAFAVNLDAADASRLQVSSKLLALARAVRREGPEKH